MFNFFLGRSIVEDDKEQTDASKTKILGSSKSNEVPFQDTILRDSSLYVSELCISEYESDDDGSGEVCYENADASSSEFDEDYLMLGVKELNISYNEDFIAHDTVNVDDHQSNETKCVDMDITSELEPELIECNIPIMSQEQQNNKTTLKELFPQLG